MKSTLSAVLLALAVGFTTMAAADAGAKPRPCRPHRCSTLPPSVVAEPSISGVAEAGQTLSGSPGEWSSASPVTYVYDWRRCDGNGLDCVSTGSSAVSYAVTETDVASTVRLAVTATNDYGSSTATSAPTAVIAPVPAEPVSAGPLPANPSASRWLGVSVPWSSSWLSDLDAYATRVGRVPSIVMWFSNFAVPMLDVTRMNAVTSRGSTPMVTVEPWDGSSATDSRYTLANIARGDFDSWFAAGAVAAVAYGKPFYLRFAPEMNGAWAPWEAGVNGNTAQGYVDAWRHVHAIFTARGASNVRWVWAPNVFSRYGTAVDFRPYYPGSDVVDVLGLDGYNWGSLDVWQSWSQVFGSSYDALCTLDATLPVMVTETASTELGGDKAAWITGAFTQEIQTRTPRVKAVIWFDKNKETDWRVASSTASLGAYRAVATSVAWG